MMKDDDETSADVGTTTTTDNSTWSDLQRVESVETSRNRFDANDESDDSKLTAPETRHPREATIPCKTKNDDEKPHGNVQHNLSLAPGLQPSSPPETKQRRSNARKSLQKKELQSPLQRRIKGALSTSNDHDYDIEDNDLKTFPGAVSVEGTRMVTMSAPSQEREPLPPLVYAAVVHRDDDDDGNHHHVPTTNQQTPSQVAVLVEKEGPCGISTRSWFCGALGFMLAATVAAVVALVLTLSPGEKSPEALTAVPPPSPTTGPIDSRPIISTNSPTNSPADRPTLNDTTNSPTYSPTNTPSQKIFMYPKSQPHEHGDGGGPFDHLEEFGYFASGESLIDKITQLRVYVTEVCATNNDCNLPTALVLSLVVTYGRHDCVTIESRTQGAYTDGTATPRATLNFPPDVYLTRMEFTSEYVTICDSTMDCTEIGPYNGTEPDMIFERNNSAIKAFYGMSGSWVDAVGVYYESYGQSTSNCN